MNTYVRLCAQNTSRKTRVVPIIKGLAAWNEVKHFSVEVNRNKRHPVNLFSVEVYTFSGGVAAEPKQLGSVSFHLHELIRAHRARDEFNIFSGDTIVGTLHLDIAFSYGVFGYGYSPQLTDVLPVTQALKRSLFPRVAPPRRRTDTRKAVIMAKLNPTPAILNAEPAVLTPAERMGGVEVADSAKHYPLLVKQMTQLTRIREKCQGLTRHDRLRYLHESMFDASRRRQHVSLDKEMSRGSHAARPFMKYMQPAKMPIGTVKRLRDGDVAPVRHQAEASTPPLIVVEDEEAIDKGMPSPRLVTRRQGILRANGQPIKQRVGVIPAVTFDIDEEAERRREKRIADKPRPRSPPPRMDDDEDEMELDTGAGSVGSSCSDLSELSSINSDDEFGSL